jgi:hypothetical protein
VTAFWMWRTVHINRAQSLAVDGPLIEHTAEKRKIRIAHVDYAAVARSDFGCSIAFFAFNSE